MTPIPEGSDLARLLGFLDGVGYQRRKPADDPDGLTTSDRLIAAFNRKAAGLVEPAPGPGRHSYTLTEGEQSARRRAEPGVMEEFTYQWSVVVDEGIGYPTFYCEFYFAAEGTLLDHGVWE